MLDELFDLSRYKALRGVTPPAVHHTLDPPGFWKKFFELNLGQRIKLSFMMLVCRIFGSIAVHRSNQWFLERFFSS